jgi:flagellar biosynthesis/type III secretory pathway protein FliH
MSENFVPLAAFLRPPPPPPPEALEVQTPDEGIDGVARSDDIAAEYASIFSAIRRFRAGVADALDAAVQRLLEQIAENVVARELQIAPPNIAAIVAKSRECAAAERVLAVRVHPAQRAALATLDLEVHEDERLQLGDVVVELRSGTIDLRLRTRIAMALMACER